MSRNRDLCGCGFDPKVESTAALCDGRCNGRAEQPDALARLKALVAWQEGCPVGVQDCCPSSDQCIIQDVIRLCELRA